MKTPNFFETVLNDAIAWVTNLFAKAKTEIPLIQHSIAQFGNAVINEYKILDANPEVQLLADWFVKIAEAIDPALIPLISGIELEFPKIIKFITGAITEVEKPVEQILGDGLAKFAELKKIPGIYHANALGGASAAIQNYVLTNNATVLGVAPTAAQLITTSQVVHAVSS